MEALKDIRLRHGLSQVDLSKRSGVAQNTISDIETGRRDPRPSTLRRLAKALDVEVVDFYPETRGPKATAPPWLAEWLGEWLKERCGHGYLALPKAEFEEMFDQFPEGAPERRTRALEVNQEYNTFCKFPKNVTPAERFSMRKMIRAAIPEVAVKHGIALMEGGLEREYQEEAALVFELERTLDAEAEIA